MMKKGFPLIFTAIVLVIAFQNCSPQHTPDHVGTFNIQSVYPYQSKPTYFDDVQIIAKDKSGSTWSYKFIASVVHAENENSILDVELTVLKESGDLVCPRVEAQVTRGTNHMEITNCTSSEDLSVVKVEVKAAKAGENLATLRVHTFELE